MMFSKPSIKCKHVTIMIEQKLDIVKHLEKDGNRNCIMSDYNIGSSMIYNIQKKKMI